MDSTNIDSVPFDQDLLFIKNQVYRASYWSENYIFDSSEVKTVSNNLFGYDLMIIDSSSILLTESNDTLFFSRTKENKASKKLNAYREGQSFKKDYVGRYEQKDLGTFAIKLLNNSQYCDTLSFEIYPDGQATFYPDFKKENAVQYSYRLDENGITFLKGCLQGNYKWQWNADRSEAGLRFSDMLSADTIWFKRESLPNENKR